MESWNQRRYESAGVRYQFVQDNVSWSHEGVLRGMHFQAPRGQAKLVSVLQGEIFDAVVDVRSGSPTFGLWFGCVLSHENRRQLLVPDGFAHGFLVTSQTALVLYKVSAFYDPGSEGVLSWQDPAVGIEWPTTPTGVSPRDRAAPLLAELDPARLPVFVPSV